MIKKQNVKIHLPGGYLLNSYENLFLCGAFSTKKS